MNFSKYQFRNFARIYFRAAYLLCVIFGLFSRILASQREFARKFMKKVYIIKKIKPSQHKGFISTNPSLSVPSTSLPN